MNHETLWAREGDLARDCWEVGAWSAFASYRTTDHRRDSRIDLHGFDFRVESQNGTKTMIIEEAP